MNLQRLEEFVSENNHVSSLNLTSLAVDLCEYIIDIYAQSIPSTDDADLYLDRNDSASSVKSMVRGVLYQEKLTLCEPDVKRIHAVDMNKSTFSFLIGFISPWPRS